MTPAVFIETTSGSLSGSEFMTRLSFLSLVDEAGLSSDELSFRLDNGEQYFGIPEKGERLIVHMGYDRALSVMGLFTLDEVSSTGGRGGASLSFKAKAADMLQSLKVKKTRSWTTLKLGEIVSRIAGEHELEPAISDVLADIEVATEPYAQLDQTQESDLHFLQRLATRYDAIAKPSEGKLHFIPAAEFKGGEAANSGITLHETEVTNWTAIAPDRGRYKAATAGYLDPLTKERTTVTAGEGTPVFALTNLYPDANTAQAAAEGRLKALKRGTHSVSLDLPGRANLRAETKVNFVSEDPLANGQWIVRRATHEISPGTGYTTRLEMDAPNAKK